MISISIPDPDGPGAGRAGGPEAGRAEAGRAEAGRAGRLAVVVGQVYPLRA
jgi:hypothetical protein